MIHFQSSFRWKNNNRSQENNALLKDSFEQLAGKIPPILSRFNILNRKMKKQEKRIERGVEEERKKRKERKIRTSLFHVYDQKKILLSSHQEFFASNMSKDWKLNHEFLFFSFLLLSFAFSFFLLFPFFLFLSSSFFHPIFPLHHFLLPAFPSHHGKKERKESEEMENETKRERDRKIKEEREMEEKSVILNLNRFNRLKIPH